MMYNFKFAFISGLIFVILLCLSPPCGCFVPLQWIISELKLNAIVSLCINKTFKDVILFHSVIYLLAFKDEIYILKIYFSGLIFVSGPGKNNCGLQYA